MKSSETVAMVFMRGFCCIGALLVLKSFLNSTLYLHDTSRTKSHPYNCRHVGLKILTAGNYEEYVLDCNAV
jgi:hypothetical protein